MSGLKVLYKDNQITASNTSVIKKLLTSGKYCEDNTTLVYDNPLAPNLIPESVEVSSANIYNNGLGYKNGYYISSGSESANVNDCLTGCISYIINGVQPTDILYIKGYTGGASESHTRLCVRKADKTRVTEFNGFLSSNNIFDVTVLDTGYYKLTPKSGIHHSYADIGYIQFSFHQSDASQIVITKNEEVSYEELLEAVNVPFTFGDIPDYVKTEAIAVAEKVRAVQTANTITSICWADAHHTKDQVTGWQAQTNISTLHAAMGMSIIAASCPIDFCAYCGDYTFGNGNTTYDLFEGQVKEMNKYMDVAFGGVPAMYCVGNHDTGEYYLRDGTDGALYGAANVYKLIGGRNDDGATVMGSTTYGYCYRDITAKKIRVINLNTVEGETDSGYLGGQCSDAQLLWFAQALYSVGSNSDWGIIVVSHYPLDYGGTCHAGNIVYQYVNGGSVTYNGTTVNFSGHNSAKFVAQYHGHTHCFKVAKINYVSNNQGTEFDAYRLATPSGTFYRNNDYANTTIYGINFGEETTYTKTANSGKDTAFVVNVYNPSNKIIHSFCYGAGYDRLVSIGPTIFRDISYSLSHIASSNHITYIEDGESYQTTLSANSGYDIGTVTVTMGGLNITSTAYNSSTGVISIASVTGNVTIIAEAVIHVNYHNVVNDAINSDGTSLPYINNKYINSSGVATDSNGYTTTGFIPLENENVKHIYRFGGDEITWSADDSYARIAWYDSSFNLLKLVQANRIDYSVYFPSSIETNDESIIAFKVTNSSGNVVSNVPSSAAYFRVSAKGSGQNLIITLDEEIETGVGNLINTFGYTNDKRISQTTGDYKDETGSTVIEFIDLSEFVVNEQVIIHITGAQFEHQSSPWDNCAYVFYNASKNVNAGDYTTGTTTFGNITVTVSSVSSTKTTIAITGLIQAYVTNNYHYLRLCGVGDGANVDIRIR